MSYYVVEELPQALRPLVGAQIPRSLQPQCMVVVQLYSGMTREGDLEWHIVRIG